MYRDRVRPRDRGYATSAGRRHVAGRFPARLHKARHDTDLGSSEGRVRRTAVHATRVPHDNIRQPFFNGHRPLSRDARCVEQRNVRQEQQHDVQHVRTVPLRRVSGSDLGKDATRYASKRAK